MDLRYNQEPGPQVDQNTPKRHPEWRPSGPPQHGQSGPAIRPMGPSPHYPGPPPYPNQNVNEGMRRLDIGHTSPNKTRPPGPAQEQVTRRQPRETRLHLRGEKPVKTVMGGGTPGMVVQGPRTAVMMGAGSTPPGVDLDKVAASISEQNQMSNSLPVSQPRQFGRSLAGVLSGAAQNIKSKIAGIANNPGGSSPLVRSSPSPPDTRGKMREVPIRVENSYGSNHSVAEPSDRSPQVIPLTVPGAEIQQREYGYPIRLDKRPLGPRETPNFQKKQEYL